jgi:N-acetylglucosaminyldiphosphoundecaprenol N-acetyl-beta-D-mannosaminyltransferase
MMVLDILKIPFTFFENNNEFEEKILQLLNEDRLHTIFTPNAEIIVNAYKDKNFQNILKNSSLNLPDGIGIILLTKKLGYKGLKRFAGIDAMINLINISQKKGLSIYFLGAKEEVLKDMIEKLRMKFPKIIISGFHHGFFSEVEIEKIIEDINRSKSDILFVALGAPKQEYFIYKNKEKLNVKIAMGVGGSFDVLSERKKRAPKIFIILGLEWLYRLIQEPKRIIKRLPNLLYFLYILLRYDKKIF